MKLIWITLLAYLLIITCHGTRGNTRPPHFVYISNWAKYKLPSKLDVKHVKNILQKLALYKRLEYCPFENSDCTNENNYDIVSKIIQDETDSINKSEIAGTLMFKRYNNPHFLSRDSQLNEPFLNKYRSIKENKNNVSIKIGSINTQKFQSIGKRPSKREYSRSKGDPFTSRIFSFKKRGSINTQKFQSIGRRPSKREYSRSKGDPFTSRIFSFKKKGSINTQKFKSIGGRPSKREDSSSKVVYLDFQVIL